MRLPMPSLAKVTLMTTDFSPLLSHRNSRQDRSWIPPPTWWWPSADQHSISGGRTTHRSAAWDYGLNFYSGDNLVASLRVDPLQTSATLVIPPGTAGDFTVAVVNVRQGIAGPIGVASQRIPFTVGAAGCTGPPPPPTGLGRLSQASDREHPVEPVAWRHELCRAGRKRRRAARICSTATSAISPASAATTSRPEHPVVRAGARSQCVRRERADDGYRR